MGCIKLSYSKDPDFIYIENNNDNIDFFELSDVNSVNILESLNIAVGRINKDSVKNHYGSRLLTVQRSQYLSFPIVFPSFVYYLHQCYLQNLPYMSHPIF
jgi:hypothetical protein